MERSPRSWRCWKSSAAERWSARGTHSSRRARVPAPPAPALEWAAGLRPGARALPKVQPWTWDRIRRPKLSSLRWLSAGQAARRPPRSPRWVGRRRAPGPQGSPRPRSRTQAPRWAVPVGGRSGPPSRPEARGSEPDTRPAPDGAAPSARWARNPAAQPPALRQEGRAGFERSRWRYRQVPGGGRAQPSSASRREGRRRRPPRPWRGSACSRSGPGLRHGALA